MEKVTKESYVERWRNLAKKYRKLRERIAEAKGLCGDIAREMHAIAKSNNLYVGNTARLGVYAIQRRIVEKLNISKAAVERLNDTEFVKHVPDLQAILDREGIDADEYIRDCPECSDSVVDTDKVVDVLKSGSRANKRVLQDLGVTLERKETYTPKAF